MIAMQRTYVALTMHINVALTRMLLVRYLESTAGEGTGGSVKNCVFRSAKFLVCSLKDSLLCFNEAC